MKKILIFSSLIIYNNNNNKIIERRVAAAQVSALHAGLLLWSISSGLVGRIRGDSHASHTNTQHTHTHFCKAK